MTLRLADESDQPAAPLSITDAIDAGSRALLVSMRFSLAKKLDAGDIASNAITSAYTKLEDLDRKIRAIDAAAEQEGQRRGSSGRRPFNASAL